MNVVMLSEHDYAGSGWQMTQAIRLLTDHNMWHIKATSHRYGYKTDYQLNEENFPLVKETIGQADVIHFKGDDLPAREWHGIKIPDRAKVVVTVGGSGFRRHGAKDNGAMAWHPISKYIEGSDLRTVLSPDLNYPEFKGHYTPYVIDSESQPNCWCLKEPIRIGYYPGREGLKGDQTYILPAFKALKKEFDFEIVSIQNMTYEKSVGIKKGLTLFVEQISKAGCYGNSGVEAMQFGVPVVAYISERSLRQANGTMFQSSPVLNCGSTLEGLTVLLRNILSGKLNLSEVSKQTKQYCDYFHGYEANAKLWDGLYESL